MMNLKMRKTKSTEIPAILRAHPQIHVEIDLTLLMITGQV